MANDQGQSGAGDDALQREFILVDSILASGRIQSYDAMIDRYNTMVPIEAKLELVFRTMQTLCLNGKIQTLTVFKKLLEKEGVTALASVARGTASDGGRIHALRVMSDMPSEPIDAPAFRQALARLIIERLEAAKSH